MLAILLAGCRFDFLLHIDLKFQMPMVLLFPNSISTRLSKTKFFLVGDAVLLQSIEGFEQFTGIDTLMLMLMVIISGIFVHMFVSMYFIIKNYMVGRLGYGYTLI